MIDENDPVLKFSRAGKQFAEYRLSLVSEAIRLGRVLDSDHYWQPGMGDWKKVSELKPMLKQPRAPSPHPSSNASPLPRSPEPLVQGGILATTTPAIDEHRVVRYLGIVRGIMVRSPNVVESINGFGDGIFGGKQNTYTAMCEKTRTEAYDEMLKNAKAMGANAVIGVAYDTTDVLSKCTEVLCYGTAVVIEPIR